MKVLWIWLSFINLLTILLFGADKLKAVHRKWRIRERTLLLCCFLGGAFGGLFSMLFFRHKIHTPIFRYGVPAMLILQVFLLMAASKVIII